MSSHTRVEGTALGLPGRYFRLHRVEGSDDAFLLFSEKPQENSQENPQGKALDLLPDLIHEMPIENSVKSKVIHAFSKVTGYSNRTLIKRLNLESDLGIDFIKKTKVLNLLSSQIEIPSQLVSTLKTVETVDQWVDALEFRQVRLSEAQVTELILKLAEEKTGYSREVLDLDANLEADLGIDTIKQVQIAGQIRKQYSLAFQGQTQVQPQSQFNGLRVKDFPTLRHWIRFITQQMESSSPVVKTHEVRRERIHFVEDQASGELKKLPLALRWLILKDSLDHSIAQTLKERLLSEGATEVWIEDSLEAALKFLEQGESSKSIEGVVHLGTLGILSSEWSLYSEQIGKSLALLQKLKTSLKAWISVTSLSQGDPTLLGGALSGWTRTLALERPDVVVKLVEIQSVDDLFREVFLNRLGNEARWCQGKRWLPKRIHSPLSMLQEPSFELNSDSLVMISGGAQGIGYEIAKDLARRFQVRLVLIGRSPESDDLILQKVKALNQLGSECHYRTADVRDETQLNKIVEEISPEERSLFGVIHAAGVIEDQRAELKSEESFSRVSSVKVLGFSHLSEIALRKKAQFFCCFTSVSGVFGNEGQIDYASANAAMAASINQLRKKGMKSFAMAWGPWGETGMAVRSGVSELIESAGGAVISIEEGVRAFRNELLFGGDQPEVLISSIQIPSEQTLPSVMVSDSLSKFSFLSEGIECVPGSFGRFKKVFSPTKDLWIQDHSIAGRSILPATLGIEIMVQAALSLFPDFYWDRMEQFAIDESVLIDELNPTSVWIHADAGAGMSSDEREVCVKIKSEKHSSGQSFFKGRVYLKRQRGESDPLDLPLIESSLSLASNQEHFSSLYQNGASSIPLGPFFHVLSHACQDGVGQMRGVLKESFAFSQTFFSMPVSREGGFHLASLMRMREAGELLVPHSIVKIKKFHSHVDANVREENLQIKVQHEGDRVFHVLICDEQGRLQMEIQGLKMVDVRDFIEGEVKHASR